jgi:hypothetical protein
MSSIINETIQMDIQFNDARSIQACTPGTPGKIDITTSEIFEQLDIISMVP